MSNRVVQADFSTRRIPSKRRHRPLKNGSYDFYKTSCTASVYVYLGPRPGLLAPEALSIW